MKVERRNWQTSILGGLFLAMAMLGGWGCNSFSEELFPVDITLEEIEERQELALDPNGYFANASSYVQRQVSQEIRWMEENEDMTQTEVQFVKPDKMQIINYRNNRPHDGTIINGDRGYNIDYVRARSTALNENQVRLVRALTQIGCADTQLTDFFEEITIMGSRIDGREYYKLTCRPRKENLNLPALDIYVDSETFLIRMYRAGQIVTKMTRYGMREGVMIPIVVESTIGRQRRRATVTDYALNVEIPEENFTSPF